MYQQRLAFNVKAGPPVNDPVAQGPRVARRYRHTIPAWQRNREARSDEVERARNIGLLVEPMGIEPTTSALRTLRSPN